jgi:hypothetical protein
MEKSERHHSQNNLPQEMEKFLRLTEEQGVNTYHMKITKEINIDSLVWIGFFPNGLGEEKPCLAGGELNGKKPLSPSFIESLVQKIKLPDNAQPTSMTFGLNSDHCLSEEELTPQMPIFGIIFIPKKTIGNENEMAFLRTVSDIDPAEALGTINDLLNSARGLLN